MALVFPSTHPLVRHKALVEKDVTTPMGQAHGSELAEKIGLGMVEGMWEMMPSAEVWHRGNRN